MKKTMLILGVVMFFLTSVCFGAKVDPTKIVVPRDSGRIVETYVSGKADAPFIVYLQSIHVNYEAQKAMVNVLEALIRDYGFDLVLVEGKPAGLDKDFKYLRKDKPLEARITAAEDLLKKGTISCVNYLDLTTDYNFVADGIEDLNIYKKEAADLVAIYGVRDDIAKLISVLQNIASNLKLHIYTKEMRDLDDKIAAYDKDEIGLVEYVKFVEGQAPANNIEIKAFGNVALFIESANLEGQINFPAVETERAAAVDAIEKALTDKTKKDAFAAKGLQFRTGDISQGAYYSYLKDTAQAAKIDLTPHKNLTAYTQYITTYEKIDTTLLFKELDSLVNKIKETSIKTPEQKKLSQIHKGLSILSDMANIKLIPDEYNYYQENKAGFDLDGWLKFMKENSSRFALTNPVPDDASLLKNNMTLLERFYAVSFERDNAFVTNMKASLAKHNKQNAVFIAGGFHTPNMKRLLKENGFSYLVVAPRVDVIKDYSAVYSEGMKTDFEYLQKTLTANTSSTTPPAKIERLDAAVNRSENVENNINEAIARLRQAGATQVGGAQGVQITVGNTVYIANTWGDLATRLEAAPEQHRLDVAGQILAILRTPNASALIAGNTLYGIRVNSGREFLGWDRTTGQEVWAEQGITIDDNPVRMVEAFRDIAVPLAASLGLTDTTIEGFQKAVRENTNGFRDQLRQRIHAHELGHVLIDTMMPPLRATLTEEEEEDIVQAIAKSVNGDTLTDADKANLAKLNEVARKISGVSGLDTHKQFVDLVGRFRTAALQFVDFKNLLAQRGATVEENKPINLSNVRLADEVQKRLVQGTTYALPAIDEAAARDFAAAVDQGMVEGVRGTLQDANFATFAAHFNVLSQPQRVSFSRLLENPALKGIKDKFGSMVEKETQAVEKFLNKTAEVAFGKEKEALMREEVRRTRAEDVIRQRLVANSGLVRQTIRTDKQIKGIVFCMDQSLYAEAGKDYLMGEAQAAVDIGCGLEGRVEAVRDGDHFAKRKAQLELQGYIVQLITKDLGMVTPAQLGGAVALPTTQSLRPVGGLNVARDVFRAALELEAGRGLNDQQQTQVAARVAARLSALSFDKEGNGQFTIDEIKNIIPGVKSDEDRLGILRTLARLLGPVTANNVQELIQRLIFFSYA